MSIVDKVLDIIENDLNIKISKKKKQIIYDNFYTDITDKIYNENVNLDKNKINKNIIMLIVDKVLDIIENDLNIKISKKRNKLFMIIFILILKINFIGLTELKIVFMRVLFQRKNIKK